MSRFANRAASSTAPAGAQDHQRAFELACLCCAGSITEPERKWLDEHLAACGECRANVERAEASISALRSVSVSAGSDLVQSTQRKVRSRCMQYHERQARLRPVWISSALASAWAACSTPYLWQAFDLTGHWLHIPDLLWQMGFLVAWFTPAMTAAAVAFYLRPQLTRTTRATLSRATA